MGFFKKAGVGVGALLLIAACVGGTGDDDASDKDKASDEGTSTEPTPEASPTDGATPEGGTTEDAAEPTQQDVWLVNFDDHHKRIQRKLARKLPALTLLLDTPDAAIASCDQIAAGKPLARRVMSARENWSANAGQAATVLTVVADEVCPDVAEIHDDQVTAKRKADAKEARRKAAAAAKKAERERKRRAAERREQQAREEAEQEAESVYYGSCSDVEAAGAAPIYAGDPGYSRDLDRDGDGVACEQ